MSLVGAKASCSSQQLDLHAVMRFTQSIAVRIQRAKCVIIMVIDTGWVVAKMQRALVTSVFMARSRQLFVTWTRMFDRAEWFSGKGDFFIGRS